MLNRTREMNDPCRPSNFYCIYSYQRYERHCNVRMIGSSYCADPDRRCIKLRPPLSFYSRKPVVVLPRLKRKRRKVPDPEKGEAPQEDEPPQHEDALDRHVEDVLSKRDQFRRVMQGVWSFCKTPLGVSSPTDPMVDLYSPRLTVYHCYLRVSCW